MLNLFIGELSLKNNILIVGHSFVWHYREYLNRINGPQNNYNKCLGLPHKNIYIVGKGGLKADEDGLNLITYISQLITDSSYIISVSGLH